MKSVVRGLGFRCAIGDGPRHRRQRQADSSERAKISSKEEQWTTEKHAETHQRFVGACKNCEPTRGAPTPRRHVARGLPEGRSIKTQEVTYRGRTRTATRSERQQEISTYHQFFELGNSLPANYEFKIPTDLPTVYNFFDC